MKTILLCSLFLLFFLHSEILCSQTFQKVYSAQINHNPAKLRQTADSGFVMGGTVNTSETGPLRGWQTDGVHLIKTDKSGNIFWSKFYTNGINHNQFYDLQPTTDGGYILLMTTDSLRHIMIVKTDASGNSLWIKQLGTSGSYKEYSGSIQQTNDGGYIVSGSVSDVSLNLYTTPEVYLSKLSGTGILQWSKIYENMSVGEDRTSVNVKQTNDGGYIITSLDEASEGPGNVGQSAGYLIKTDSFGTLQWAKHYAGLGWSNYSNSAPVSVEQTTDRGYIIGGSYYDIYDIVGRPLLIKTDSIGNISWSKVYPDKILYNGQGVEVHQTNDGGYAFLTLKQTTGDLGYGIPDNSPGLLKTDSVGNLQWSRGWKSNHATTQGPVSLVLLKQGGYGILAQTPRSQDMYTMSDFTLITTDSIGVIGGSSCVDTLVSVSSTPLITVSPVTVTTGTGPALTTATLTITDYTTTVTDVCLGHGLVADFSISGYCDYDSVVFNNLSWNARSQIWNFGDPSSGTSNTSTLISPKHKFTSAGTFSVTLTVYGGSGEDSSNTKAVVINPSEFITASGNISICQGDSTVISAGGIDAGGWWNGDVYGIRYWDPVVGLRDTNNVNAVAIPAVTTTYSIKAYNGYCFDTAMVTVTVHPSGAAIIGIDSICRGNSTVLIASGGGSYLWITGSQDSSITVNPLTDCTYWVAVSNSACTDTAKTTITVLNPLINAGSNATINYGESIVLNATGDGYYQWMPSTGLSCTDCTSPTAAPEITTVYYLFVTDTNGCITADSVTVFLDLPCGEVFVPSAFSPNNDRVNDVLYLKNDCIKQLEFKIFDRWGNKVFQTAHVNEGWDGTYKGEAMDPAVFVYYVNVALLSGESITKKGNVSLIR